MKKIFNLALLLFIGILSSCDDRLDIVPKGQTTLNNLKDIELLLNQNIRLEEDPSAWMGLLIDECYPAGIQVSAMLSNPNSASYAYLTYDESVDRVSLATEDERFRQLYRNINFMNVVIDRVNDIDPESQTGKRLIAEAKVMRAYLHFLCVNIYAAQYDETTAEKLGGICYVDEIDITKVKNKLTLAEAYGLRVETMYYIIAECEIRAGNYATGLDYVDQVRAKRVEDYEPFATRSDLDEATAMALLQDAKTIEFFASCENFFDRKRWNTEPAYSKSIVRDLGELGKYTLRPDSKLYICPFPANSTRYCPSLSQNI